MLGPLTRAVFGFGLCFADHEDRVRRGGVGRFCQPGDPVRAMGFASDLERTLSGGHGLGHSGFIL